MEIVTDFLKDKMKMHIEDEEIITAHRLGKKLSKKPHQM